MYRAPTTAVFLRWRSGDLIFAQERDDRRTVAGKRGPDGTAPIVDGAIAVGSGRRGEHIENGEAAAILGEMDRRPDAFKARHLHMHFLNLTTGKLFFEMEIEANETKDQSDGLGLVSCGLQGKGVRDVLEDKAGAAHRVDVNLVVGGTERIHGERSVAKK